MKQCSGKIGDAEFMADVELEEWREDRDTSSLFRRVQQLFNMTPKPSKSRKQTSSTRNTSSSISLYSEDENEIIKSAVQRYLKVSSTSYVTDIKLDKMTEAEFGAMLEAETQEHYSKRKSRGFVKDLAQLLPGRSVLSVTRHLLKLYPVEQYEKIWTKKDDLKLKELVAQKGKLWTKVASELGRSPEIVRLRYKDYVSLGEGRNKGFWNEGEINRFDEAVMEKLTEEGKAVPDFDSKQAREAVGELFDWNGVSERVKTRSRLQCRARWIQIGVTPDKE